MTPLSLLIIKIIISHLKVRNTNQTHIWHLCLDHINLNIIQRPIKYGILHSLILEDLSLWESYIEDKMTRDDNKVGFFEDPPCPVPNGTSLKLK